MAANRYHATRMTAGRPGCRGSRIVPGTPPRWRKGRDGAGQPPRLAACRRSASEMARAALMSPMWLKAWGKLPSSSPVDSQPAEHRTPGSLARELIPPATRYRPGVYPGVIVRLRCDGYAMSCAKGGRQVIFLGGLVDFGPASPAVLRLAMGMISSSQMDTKSDSGCRFVANGL